ncbi:hypothetical protein [Thiocystis violacea]|uniref:hypothetical protein n=1 Tax=Thiocystis violacea TaxID=13725 RepID=UPI0019048FA7|nr:hypothetical protein [Thiocystis violacea]
MTDGIEAGPDPADPISDRKTGGEVTPDLAVPESPLAPIFPLAADGTRLVLYPGAPGELRVSWSLRANDVVSHGAGFPVEDGRPEAVLRLTRFRYDGGGELAQETRLRPSGIGGHGDLSFGIGDDYSRFEAELGLVNGEGGWLLLARSNRLQHARGLGLDGIGFGARSDPAGLESGVADQPAQSIPFDWGAAPVSTKSTGIASAAGPWETHEARSGDGVQTGAWEDSSLIVGGEPPIAWNGDRNAQTPALSGLDAQDPAPSPIPGQNLRAESDFNGSSAKNATVAAFRIPVLSYGKPPASGNDLVIEAELRILGWAAPNSEIDLFGHRYRVGPGGRFQFVLRVDDPDLLRRALAQHPPPELNSQRED